MTGDGEKGDDCAGGHASAPLTRMSRTSTSKRRTPARFAASLRAPLALCALTHVVRPADLTVYITSDTSPLLVAVRRLTAFRRYRLIRDGGLAALGLGECCICHLVANLCRVASTDGI